jgi:hypothetical protein
MTGAGAVKAEWNTALVDDVVAVVVLPVAHLRRVGVHVHLRVVAVHGGVVAVAVGVQGLLAERHVGATRREEHERCEKANHGNSDGRC